MAIEMRMRYRVAQYSVDGAIRRSEKLYALAPEAWRRVDNRKAYIEKRMKMDSLI